MLGARLRIVSLLLQRLLLPVYERLWIWSDDRRLRADDLIENLNLLSVLVHHPNARESSVLFGLNAGNLNPHDYRVGLALELED